MKYWISKSNEQVLRSSKENDEDNTKDRCKKNSGGIGAFCSGVSVNKCIFKGGKQSGKSYENNRVFR